MPSPVLGLQVVGSAGEAYNAAKAAANALIIEDCCKAANAGNVWDLPAGLFRIAGDQNADYPGVCDMTVDATFRGETNGRTQLQMGPDLAATAMTMFGPRNGVQLSLQRLDLLGTPQLTHGVEIDGSDTVPTFGVRSAAGGKADLSDVKLSLWNQCLKQEGGGVLTADRCTVKGRGLSILCIEGAAASKLVLTNSDVALDDDHFTAGTHNRWHNLYINSGVDLEVRKTNFTKNDGYGILAGFGGSGIPTASRIIDGCNFSGSPRPVYFGPTGDTVLTNSNFDASADSGFQVAHITPAGRFRVANSTFKAVATYLVDQYAVLDDQNTLAAGVFESCAFTGCYVYTVRRTIAAAIGALGFRHCSFGIPYASGFTLGSEVGAGVIDCWRSDFLKLSGALASPSPNNRVRFSECTLGGASTFSGIG